jgi:hypothetical protein
MTDSAEQSDPASVTETDAATAESLLLLSQAIERLAAAPPTTAEPAPSAAPVAVTSGPHVWLIESDSRMPLTESVSQVAFAEQRGRGKSRLETLQGLTAYRTLSFASPALAIANEIGSLFRSDDPTVTAVWALPGPAATHRLAADATFDVEFESIPGIDPDDYEPAVVQLIPTADNFRLVAAARTKISDLEAGTPTETIVEERIDAEIVRTDRGRFTVSLGDEMHSGEYALVLRPVERRSRRRNEPQSLGELLGTGGGQMLYRTWDFTLVAAERSARAAEHFSLDLAALE